MLEVLKTAVEDFCALRCHVMSCLVGCYQIVKGI